MLLLALLKHFHHPTKVGKSDGSLTRNVVWVLKIRRARGAALSSRTTAICEGSDDVFTQRFRQIKRKKSINSNLHIGLRSSNYPPDVLNLNLGQCFDYCRECAHIVDLLHCFSNLPLMLP